MSIVVNSQEFINEVQNGEGVAVVDFFATWCGPCKMLEPVFQEVGSELQGKAKFVKVDIDQSLDIARQYNVSSVPTVLVMKDGKPVEVLVGFMPKENLLNKVKNHL